MNVVKQREPLSENLDPIFVFKLITQNENMKQFIILAFLFFVVGVTISTAQSNQNANILPTDYLKKSKHQKTAAWLLLGGGSIAWFAGVSKNMNQNDNIDGGGKGAMVIGGVAVLSSIPFFIMASKNKRKAASVSFKMEQSPYLKVAKRGNIYFPAVSYRLNIR